MKFKMAPNSLFAILLRSPWWISFVLAVAIMSASLAWLPARFAVYGAIGGLPIAGVGLIAAWRQLRAPSAMQVSANVDAALAMPWRELSKALENAWQQAGYSVERLEGTEGAADLRLTEKGQVTLVSARRWKAASHGVEPLRQLHAAMQAQGADAGIYIAAQGIVTEQAQTFARDHNLTLLPASALAQLLSSASA
ncbi:restriction endonuclease [Simplicispira psychrophila]|uniref:restriction endonuclease n=1 Tax=Simplicispira psychrophila TaxID=80882 RepID=UPI00316AE513